MDFQQQLLSSREGLHPAALRFTKCSEQAKDLIQETVMLAWQYRDQYQPNSNMQAWLFTIMRNSYINLYRRNKKKKVVSESIASISKSDANGVYNSYYADCRVTIAHINAAIHQLPFVFKLPFELFVAGYKYREIALITSETTGTIKSRIHFARKMLRKILNSKE